MTPPYRTAVFGFGEIAGSLSNDPKLAGYFRYATHAQVLTQHPHFVWDTVVDPSAEAQRRGSEEWGIAQAVSNPSALRSPETVDIAVITAPPSARPEIIDALPNLRAVMVEKPLGTFGGEGGKLIDLCQRRNIPVQVNYWRRGARGFQDLVGDELNELIGKPQAAFATYGNGLFNNGSHLVDFSRMLLGEPNSVQACADATACKTSKVSGDVHIPFTLGYDSGCALAVHPLDFEHFRELGLDLWGTSGRLEILLESLFVRHARTAPNRALENTNEMPPDCGTMLDIPVTDALWNMYDNLVAALAGSTKLFSPGESALTSERILEAVVSSSRSGGERIGLRN